MFPLNTINVLNPSAEPFVSYINDNMLEVFEPNLYYARFSEAPISQVGYKSVTWIKPDRYEVTPAQAELSPGITPPDTGMKLNTITTEAVQYGIYTIISDELSLIAANLNLAAKVSQLIGANMARIVDRVIQDEILDNAIYRLYASTTSGGARAANRNALTANSKIFALDMTRMNTILQDKWVPLREGDKYISLMHPRVIESLLTETNTGSFIDVRKYSQPEDIIRGEIGTMANIRIISAPYNKVVQNASGVNIYQTPVFGKEAYGMAQLDNMRSIVHPFGSAGTADPLDQRMTIGAKTFFAAKILQQEAIIVFESAGAF